MTSEPSETFKSQFPKPIIAESPDQRGSKEGTQRVIDLDEHQLLINDLLQRYSIQVDLDNPSKSMGLLDSVAAARLASNGPNAITPPKKKSPWLLFIHQLLGLFNILLMLYLGIILFVVAAANAFIDFYQQYRTASILESFLSLVPPEAMIIRENTMKNIQASKIVIGDVLYLKAGDKVPADCRLFNVTDMKIDNSSITGESEALDRTVESSVDNPLEASNLAFSGTMVVNGEGYGIVIRTGDRSVLGQIAKLTIGEQTPKSQLTIEINNFVRILTVLAIATAVIFFVICLVLGYSVGMTFSFAIGIFVAFVPQGLPLTVSTLLTIAAKRMALRNVLVKNLHAVETLGSITLLATDKTGTLTQNKMSVVGLWLNQQFFSTSEMGTDPLISEGTSGLDQVVQACALCTKSKFVESEIGIPLRERTILGDATEIGLLRFASHYADPPRLQVEQKKVFEVPFSSMTKWHLTVHRIERENSHFTTFIKGAPERVAARCKFILVDNEIREWTEETLVKFNEAYEHFAINGRRLIAVGHQILSSDEYPTDFVFTREPTNIPMGEFVFLGLVAIMDPPKHGVRKAIAALRTAGIQMVMVTGDHPLTAEAIARQIGLISGDTILDASLKLHKPIQMINEDDYDAVVVHGEKLDLLSDEDWDRVLAKREIVFARTSPKQKLDIVSRFQNKGHIVGVSGDGVNDSPALKKADLGISMNMTASDVSKEAASMILLDDHFPSIVNGIAEGRLIFANLKKSIRYTITHTVPEVAAFLVFVTLAIPLPINSLLILLIDLGSELGPALSFAFEQPESDLMMIPPRKVLCQPQIMKKESAIPFDSLDLEASTRYKPGDLLNENEIITATPTAATTRWGRKIWRRVKTFFTRKDTGEVLVDADLVLWSFLQGGIIEGLGCFGAYLIVFAVYHVPFDMLVGSANTFWKLGAPPIILTNGATADASMQLAISGSSQSAYYAAIVICQLFVLWVTKHRFYYPYGMDMFRNKYTYIGAGIALCVASIVIYVPGLNNIVLEGGPVPVLALLAPVAAGVLLFFYECGRIFLRRRGYFGGIPKRNVNLLDLVRTTSSIK